jgi:hypothetical protein
MHKDLVLRFVETQALLITPIAPHWAEYIWQEVLGKVRVTSFIYVALHFLTRKNRKLPFITNSSQPHPPQPTLLFHLPSTTLALSPAVLLLPNLPNSRRLRRERTRATILRSRRRLPSTLRQTSPNGKPSTSSSSKSTLTLPPTHSMRRP